MFGVCQCVGTVMNPWVVYWTFIVLAPSAGRVGIWVWAGALEAANDSIPFTLKRSNHAVFFFSNLTCNYISLRPNLASVWANSITSCLYLGGGLPFTVLSWICYYYSSTGVVVQTVNPQTAENHVTWRVTSMAALGWGSNWADTDSLAFVSFPSSPAVFAGPGRRWRPE